MKPESGFREHAHTADWELEVWAPDLPGLLEQAARGMNALMGMRLRPGLVQIRTLELEADDAEGLLVRFLTELLWFIQQEWIGFDGYALAIDSQHHLHATLQGREISDLDKEIKAITYHNLEVIRSDRNLRVTIVFDV